MKHISTYFVSLITVATLAGCASPTYYQASGADKRVWGYTEKQVDGALFRVSYIDSSNAGTERTYAYAMYRAAELAREKGATHFEVLEGMVNRDMLERFIAMPLQKTASLYDPDRSHIVDAVTGEVLVNSALAMREVLPLRPARTFTQTYIYIPLAPPPPPQQVSLLVRLLNAPSLDPAKGFEVQDLLTRLGPKVLRAPLKSV
jgi:hypothetical protein